MKLDYLPQGYDRIKVVGGMTELLNTPWGNTNAILYPRSFDIDFQKLAPHFKSLANVIIGQHNTVYTTSMKDLGKYRNKTSASEQRFCLDYIINDIESLKHQCVKYWELRVQKSANTNFHFDTNSEGYPHTIITTYFGQATRWIRDEDIDCIEKDDPKPKADALIHAFRAGDICKFDNEGNPSFFHAGRKGFRMTLVAR